MKRLALLLIALFPAFASAQTVPPPFNTFGAVPTIAQWQTAWASKLDVTGGALTTLGPMTIPVGVSGGVPYFSSTTVMGASALLTANALMIGGGAGVAPSTTTTGAGVLTAAGKATNTAAGGLIIDGGAPLVVAVRSASTSPVTVSATTDYFLCLDPTSVTITVNLPASPTTGLTYLVKDCTGQSASHSIIVTPAAGNIDGAASFTISTAFSSVAVTYTGSQWSIN